MKIITNCVCGASPEIIKVGDNKQYYVIKCPQCHKILAPHNCARITIYGAINEWNKRSLCINKT